MTTADLEPPIVDGQPCREGDSSLPYIRPVPAASMIVVDSSGAEPRVLMGRRHANHAFVPGRYVFPGGRVDPTDRQMNVAGALHEAVELRLMKDVARPSPGRARAQALAAIRETFEETGLLIGSRDYGAPERPPAGVWSDYAAHGLYPELDVLHLVARAVTPPGRVRRFDTAFFAVDAACVAECVEGVAGPDGELVDLVWLPLSKADRLDLLPITRAILTEFEGRLAAGMSPLLPCPFYRTERGVWRRSTL